MAIGVLPDRAQYLSGVQRWTGELVCTSDNCLTLKGFTYSGMRLPAVKSTTYQVEGRPTSRSRQLHPAELGGAARSSSPARYFGDQSALFAVAQVNENGTRRSRPLAWSAAGASCFRAPRSSIKKRPGSDVAGRPSERRIRCSGEPLSDHSPAVVGFHYVADNVYGDSDRQLVLPSASRRWWYPLPVRHDRFRAARAQSHVNYGPACRS